MRLAPKSFAMATLITALVATGPLSTDMYLPALPDIGRAFLVDTAAVQMTLSVFLFGFAVAQLLLGPLSDKYGRRPILVGGMFLYLVASLACVWADSIEVLTIARFFQAVGVCAGSAVGRAVVRDIHGREVGARMLLHISAAIAVAPLVAPLLGGQLALAFGWSSVFMAMAVVGAVLFGITAIMLPETNLWREADALNPKRFSRNYAALLGMADYRAYLMSTAFCFSGLFAFISGSSFVLIEDLGMTMETFGFAFGFVVVGYMVGAQVGGRMTKRFGVARMVSLGGRLAALTGTAGFMVQVFMPPTVFSVIMPMALYLVSVGLILPNAMAGAIGPHQKMAGAASALLGFVQMAMAAGAGVLVGVLHDGTPVPMMAVVALCGLLTFVYARRAERASV